MIGVGGMGEVYRATDTNLKRPVAIKVLPDSVSGEPERLARFQREAEVLASQRYRVMATPMVDPMRPGKLRPLFEATNAVRPLAQCASTACYSMSPDGQSFYTLQFRPREIPRVTSLRLILNWFDDVRRLTPRRRRADRAAFAARSTDDWRTLVVCPKSGHARRVHIPETLGLRDQRFQRLPAIRKNSLNVGAHLPAGEPRRSREVFDVVDHPRPVRRGFEAVLVAPPPVRPADLPVDKTDTGLPSVDPRRPRDRNPVQHNPVGDSGTFVHRDGHRRHDPEIEPRRREPLEVSRVREERERLLQRGGDDGLSVQVGDAARWSQVRRST